MASRLLQHLKRHFSLPYGAAVTEQRVGNKLYVNTIFKLAATTIYRCAPV